MNRPFQISTAVLLLVATACGDATEAPDARPAAPATGTATAVLDTTIAAAFEASGTAQPFSEATLSTRLMGTVTAVLATEGAQVAVSAPLVRIDAADLEARDLQATAGVAGAEAALQDATVTASRIRALYADSAAPQAQLDAAESGLARARAGLAAARAGQAELSAVRSYSTIRAPFAGVVSRRFVDAGDFAAPGAPLLVVQD
ncbi:MAG: efflux RND transporter periplasmic adaptor subunit, partial [Gemmatimonadota bacterium]|nr:efflux RND transporter periplasmic adaptor subunit [Gemmatimonadota bacterium]